jgi:dsDNA-specific endonuclease/ATPase MutS2
VSLPFKLGQRVRALHAEWAGQVTQLQRGGLLAVLTDEGIEITVQTSDVVADAAPLAERHLPSRSKETKSPSKPSPAAHSTTAAALDLVDLHLSELPSTYQALADREGALAAQLAYLEAQLTRACAAKLPKLTVLHGTGSGMLRAQVIAKLRDRPEVLSIEPEVSGRFGLGSAVVIRLRQQA